ncbi:MAG: hypothetical protein ACHQX4_10945 [Gemmatimonadales bacterium]
MRDTTADIAALTNGLQRALGDDMVSLMLYGSAARGTAVRGYSDVNVLLVLRQASADVLRRAAGALTAWGKAGHPSPLIQTEAEWAASTDVFPMEIDDIREAHRLLAGRDVVSGLATARADVREELERESRGKLIRLRAGYAASAADGKALGSLLAGATGTFLTFFRAALRLAGRPIPAEPAGVVREASLLAGFDAAAFAWALEERGGAKPKKLGPYDPVAAAYLAAVERFVKYVNDLT